MPSARSTSMDLLRIDSRRLGGLVGVLTVLLYVILFTGSVSGCTCELKHPQKHFCDSSFVIKATVKRTDVLFENEIPANSVLHETDMTQPQDNLHDVIDTVPLQHKRSVPSAPPIKSRIYFVKVKKVFKYTEEYGAIEARYKDDDIELLPIYTPNDDSLCAAHLNLTTTYLIQGSIRDNELHIGQCDHVRVWDQQNVPVYMRKAYSKLFEDNCQCQVVIGEEDSVMTSEQCLWNRNTDPDGCYSKHGVCMMRKKEHIKSRSRRAREHHNHCVWSKPASLRACLAKSREKLQNQP